MKHLQTIQTTNHVSQNIHENPKLQINKHKVTILINKHNVTILSKIRNLNKNINRKSRLITPKATGKLAMALNNLAS